jgi:hypothetical protein
MKRLQFFALRQDIQTAVEAVEAQLPLEYTRMGVFPNPHARAFTGVIEIPSLGLADSGSAITCATYLVSKWGAPVRSRPIHQNDGSLLHGIDQLLNPDTVVFSPAGVWEGRMLLSGRFDTASDSPDSQELMLHFGKALASRYKKVRSFYVGPEAVLWLEAGRRLTGAEQSPIEFDLAPKQ